MENPEISRRTWLKTGTAAFGGVTALHITGPAQAFGQTGDDVIPWLDQPPPAPDPTVGNLLKWETLDSWIMPTQKFFFVSHYGIPQDLDESTWNLELSGLLARPQSLSIADLKARARRDVDFTLECSGNHGFPEFVGAVGNARWGGTPLAQLLREAGVLQNASEVVFYGDDSSKVTIRDNVGVLRAGKTGSVEQDAENGLDLTITEQFARSMSISEALSPDNLLCYEMNGDPLPPEHGFPLRLIAPGWYGVANVKWLRRIEVIDRRYAGRFMARDYVSIREQERNGQTTWTFTTVGHTRLKSAPAKVTHRHGRYAVMGAAWGAPIAAVEVQVDNGPWMSAKLVGPAGDGPTEHDGSMNRPGRHSERRGYAWRLWHFDWWRPASGEHQVRSRAFDLDGNMQPAPDDPFLASRVTYWENNGQVTRRVLI